MRFTYACKIYGDKDQCECFIQNLVGCGSKVRGYRDGVQISLDILCE